VYYNRIQTNGQLSGTWNTTALLPGSVCGVGAAVYNGKMYVAGGRTGSATNTGVSTMAYATVNPDGSLSSFTSDDSTLPAARFDADLRIYNGYAYIIGGNLNGTLTNTVLYAPLASDGSLYGGAGTLTWKTASAFGTARSNAGASFTATNDGFMYVQGGCTAYTSDSCTAVASEIQVVQINADGSLGPWSDVATSIASLSRVGNTISLWRGTIYSLGGCTGMTAGVVSCVSGNTLNTQSYSKISDPGQVGPVNTTTVLPTATFAHGAVVNAGRIYVVGGCIKTSCQTGTADTSGNTSYATLNADGTIGSWTTDSTHVLNSAGIGGATGLAAFGMAVYNNVLYVTGGYTWGGPSSNVYYVSVDPSTGALTGNWNLQSAKLGATTYYNSAVVYRDFLFVFGGCIGNTNQAGCTTYRNTNYRMPIGSGGAPGTLTTSAATGNFLNLPTGKGLMAPALYNGYIYLAGGATSAVGQTNIILYARILDNGNITAWLGTSSGANGTTAKLVHNLRRADAVAMNGYLYVFGGHDGGGPTTYGDIEIGKITLSTGDIAGSTLTNSVIQITPRWDERAVFSNGYFYATGGCSVGDPPASCSTISSAVEYVEVFNAGNKGTSTWSNASNVYATGNVTSTAAAAYNGYIYNAGGCSSFTVGTTFANTFCSTGVNTTAYAALNPDGSIGSWTTGPTLTGTRVGGCLVQQGGYLYYIGGENATTAQTSVQYSQIGANGVPGTWQSATNGLPGARAWQGCGTFGDRIYVTGGEDNTSTEQTQVYYSPQLTSGGNITSAWSTGTAFTTARSHHTSAIIGGYLFVMGGDAGGSAFYDVQSIALNPSTGNTSGSWQYSREMPQGVSYQASVAANGYIYLIGGRTAATSCINNTYIASVNSTGLLSGWSQAVNNFTTARFGAASAYYNGYYYIMGGDDCTNILSSNVIQYGGQQSQAMKTLISKYADFNGDGAPRSFVGYLTNAVNNGVDIEKWRLQYKSSREAANSWGVTTTVYPLTNQLKNVVSALDGSSTDVKVVRWFEMSWDIDMVQSFTFTDDTQPAISQYELYYSPPPGKRLMHGKDFRDQTQQDLEANP